MMSPSLETAESQWLQQMATMRAAIAELKLPKDSTTVEYGHDLLLDDGDISCRFGDDDILVLLSDLSRDDNENLSSAKGFYATPKGYNLDWLIQQ